MDKLTRKNIQKFTAAISTKGIPLGIKGLKVIDGRELLEKSNKK